MARLKIKRLLNCQGQKFFVSSTSSNMPAHTQHNWRVLNTQKTLHLSSKVSQLTQLSSGACGPRNRILEKVPIPTGTDSQAFLKVSENKRWTLMMKMKFLSDVLVNAASMSSFCLFTTKGKFVVSDGSIDLSYISPSDHEETNNTRLYQRHAVTDRH